MDRQEILARARAKAINVEGLDTLEAIRAIQCAEGFEPCFGSGCDAICGQPGCDFRPDCEQIHIIEDPCQVVVCDIPPTP